MTRIITKWLLLLSPYYLPALPFLFIDPTADYWIGFIIGACWMFWALAVGDMVRKSKEPRR